jgi:hypothetical protein
MSTLYQLRGRVGRSSVQAYAYFFTNQTQITVEAENRLTYLKVRSDSICHDFIQRLFIWMFLIWFLDFYSIRIRI